MDYYRLVELLDRAPRFNWSNLSVPEHDPFDTDDQLQYNLRGQIRPAHVVLITAGMYTAGSNWMQWELDFARRIGAPIVGVVPWGNVQIPKAVSKNAKELVGWSTKSVVRAVRYWRRED